MEHGIFHAIRREWDSAQIDYLHALSWIPKWDSTRIGYAYCNLSTVEDELEQYDTALDHGYAALGYLAVDDSLSRPLAYLVLSKVLNKLEQCEKSEEFARRSVPYFSAPHKGSRLGQAYLLIGQSRIETDTKTDSSLVAFYPLEDTISANELLLHLGKAHYSLTNLDSAFFYFRRAERTGMFMKRRHLYKAPFIWLNIGKCHRELGEIDSALIYSNWAYENASYQSDKFTVRREAARDLSTIYTELGDPAMALKYFEEYFELYQESLELSNSTRLRAFDRIATAQYQAREIELLQQENALAKQERIYLYLGMGSLLVLLIILIL